MEKGKLIVIEGTDCSGKETQTKMLVERLEKEGFKAKRLYFPMYDTPTGKIIGGPYLGKSYICPGWFEEKANNVDPKVASLYYAADRKYNLFKINSLLDEGVNVILDRYVESNMAHQGGKIFDKNKRYEMYKWLDKLEFQLLELPKPDGVILLYIPYTYTLELKKNRIEDSDQHEMDEKHLINAEIAYLELVDIYNFFKIDCVENNKIKTREEINEEVYNHVKKIIKSR